jgi:drug/metabolite transporter (DMT)-like permease
VGVGFGLAAALCWGLADYCATVASRATGSSRVVLGFHLIATAILAVAVLATGALDGLAAGDLLELVWIGALGAISYLTFYKALEIGPISIVSPIVSAYAAVSVVLAVIVLGESLGPAQIAAVAVVMLGVMLASADLRQIHAIERRQALGLVLALVTVVAIGAVVFANAYYTIELGWLVPIFLTRLYTTLFLLGLSVRQRGPRLPDRSPRVLALVTAIALVDTGGYVAFNIGAERADTSIVSAASAPYALIPILGGVVFLRERPAPVQWLGVAAVIGGVVLLGIFS